MGKRGRPPYDDVLTPRQWEVLELLRRGRTNREIAESFDITHDTARFHVSEILGRLGVPTRSDAAATGVVQRERPSAAMREARIPRWRSGVSRARLHRVRGGTEDRRRACVRCVSRKMVAA